MAKYNLPSAFCWTKMQAEAGQSLGEIIHRKELERLSGDGIFFWGIGNSLGQKTQAFKSGQVNIIVFSRMLTKPKKIDTNPDKICFWSKYRDLNGATYNIPAHVLVTSRYSSSRATKSKHYALVCYSDKALRVEHYGSLRSTDYRNLGSHNPRIGSSQVTTIIEQQPIPIIGIKGNDYEINMIAKVTQPYFVTLLEPIVLKEKYASLVDSMGKEDMDKSGFLDGLRQLKKQISAIK